jgi:hypothetical protein
MFERENQISGCHIEMRLLGEDALQQRTLQNPLQTRCGHHALRCIVPSTCPLHWHICSRFAHHVSSFCCLSECLRVLWRGSQINANRGSTKMIYFHSTTLYQNSTEVPEETTPRAEIGGINFFFTPPFSRIFIFCPVGLSLTRSLINLVFVFRCSSSTSNPVSVRRVDSSFLVFSLSSHRYSYISLLFTSFY